MCRLKALSRGNLKKTKKEYYTAELLNDANINDFINPSNKHKVSQHE